MANKTYWKYNPVLDLFSYDSNLTLGLAVSEFGKTKCYIKLARRLANAPEQPKPGDKVYDHENSVFLALSVPQNIRFEQMIKLVLSGCKHGKMKLGVFEVEIGSGEYLEQPIPNAYLMAVTNTDTKVTDNFLFENAPISMDMPDGKFSAIPFCQNLEILVEWLTTIRKEMYIPHAPASKSGQPSNNGQNARTSASGNRFKKPNAQPTQNKPAENDYSPSGDDEDMPF